MASNMNYSEWAFLVEDKLNQNVSWKRTYKEYADKILCNEDIFKNAKHKFLRRGSLYFYLTIGIIIDGVIKYDIRYLGQSVGSLALKDDKVLLSVSEKQSNSSKKYFGFELGPVEATSWDTSSKYSRDFRKFFNNDTKGRPRQAEHMVESALFSELEKKNSANKSLRGIQPVSFAGARFHMKTAVKACESGKKGNIDVSKAGGEIDCLCRRIVRPGVSRLVAIEIKDKNEKSESFDVTLKQAISYAVFLRELLKSESGDKWKRILGMHNQYKENIAIDAVVAMPSGDTEPSFVGQIIEFDNGDRIELHYIKILSEIDARNSSDVLLETSYE